MPIWVHSIVEGVVRATVRRDLLDEIRAQWRMRATDVRDSWQRSVNDAVAFANRMRGECPAYDDRLKRDGIDSPVTIDSWNSLPDLTKDDFRRDSEAWYGNPVRTEKVRWAFTSGSTGEPFKFPLSKASGTAEMAAKELNLLALGWKPPMRRATIKVEPDPPGGLLRIYRALLDKHEIGFRAAEFRMEHVPGMVEKLRRERITYLRGYSTSVYLFANEIVQRGLKCHIPLITTLGEGLTEKQAEVVERAFSGRVYRDYGGSEAMHIGFECKEHSGYHVDLARYYVETMRDGRLTQPGEAGDIVVTAFRNRAMPLVRYRIGDVGRWATEYTPCPCGNRFPLLTEVLGRSADVVVTASGHVINVPLLVVVFEYAQEHISHFKVIQKEKGRFDVLWVARHDGAVEHIPALRNELLAKCGGGVTFDWHQVAEIPADKSGKRRIFVPLK